ncbi:hypothetical protein COLO4_17515 [Corchorus olitorius]|uniref:Uncharacterized protein n=1 Tax=Corchorus olitorius TaxID=93759 RepID=A0A1R3JCH1_9ROSI|nr:hypothetical protein COLO4_17515 [Corchorus olitorius]
MALVGNFLPKPTVLPVQFSRLPKPKTMIVCATPKKPPSRTGGGRQINSTLRLSKKTTIGVTEVTPNTTLDAGDDNQKTKANDDAAAVKGAETTD